MTAFEQYLIKQGFERMVFKDGMYHHAEGYLLSSLGNLDYRYIKDGKEICFGLHEKNKPSTLIYPRPFIKSSDPDIYSFSDDAMNRVLMKYSPEQVLNAIFDRSITLYI